MRPAFPCRSPNSIIRFTQLKLAHQVVHVLGCGIGVSVIGGNLKNAGFLHSAQPHLDGIWVTPASFQSYGHRWNNDAYRESTSLSWKISLRYIDGEGFGTRIHHLNARINLWRTSAGSRLLSRPACDLYFPWWIHTNVLAYWIQAADVLGADESVESILELRSPTDILLRHRKT